MDYVLIDVSCREAIYLGKALDPERVDGLASLFGIDEGSSRMVAKKVFDFLADRPRSELRLVNLECPVLPDGMSFDDFFYVDGKYGDEASAAAFNE